MQEAQRQYMDPSRPTFYPGQTFAGPSQSTLQGLAGMEGRAQYGSPVLGAAQSEAFNSLAGGYLGNDNPYISGMIDRTAADVLPRLQGSFGRGLPGGLQTRAATMALADSANSLRYQNYGDERARMGQYAGMAPGLAAADYMDPQMLLAAGQQREAIAQQPISEAISRHQFDTNLPAAKLADYLGAIKGIPGGTSHTVGQQFYRPTNTSAQGIGTALSAAAAIAPYAAMLFSDERLKDDMEPVGETYEGDTIYRYTMKWGGPAMFGVSAQEVAETHPDAVAMHPSGYLMVDYNQVI
jgi:hypothetical protein